MPKGSVSINELDKHPMPIVYKGPFHNGVPLRWWKRDICMTCKFRDSCEIVAKYPDIYYVFICDFYKRKRISGCLRRKLSKYRGNLGSDY